MEGRNNVKDFVFDNHWRTSKRDLKCHTFFFSIGNYIGFRTTYIKES